MADVFLSYARADQSRVEIVAAALEDAGYSLWWDKHLQGGHQFSEDIEAALADAKAVLVFWSTEAIKSEWVRDEAAYGRDHNKLVPVRLDDVLPPMGYRQRHAIDLTGDDDSEAMAALSTALDALIGSRHEISLSAPQGGRAFNVPRWAFLLVPLLLLAAFGGWLLNRSEEGTQTASAEVDRRASVAVLPFVAQSSGADDQYFADGVTEEVLNRLDALDELRVLPRTTVFAFKESQDSIDSIASKLGVEHVVEGSLRRVGDEVRVTARLVRANDSETLWSNSYDGTSEELLQFQSDIAQQVAAALDIYLDELKLQQMRNAGIDDPQAFAVYAEAQDLFDRGHTEFPNLSTLHEATLLFDEAFVLAPKLWNAQVYASDIFSHVMIDAAAGRSHPELPSDMTRQPQPELQRRLKLAMDAAPDRPSRMAVDLYATAFSDDWSTIVPKSRAFYSVRDICYSSNWGGFLFTSLGTEENDILADSYGAKADCRGADGSFLYTLVRVFGRAGRISEAETILDRVVNRAGKSREDFRPVYSLLAQHKDDLKTALKITQSDDDPVERFYTLAQLGDGERLRREMNTADVAPFLRLSLLAISGQREAANSYAAAIDARPYGPITLQAAVDACGCGAPFDLDRTPNYKRRIEQAGIVWPTATFYDYPLKDW